MKIKNKILMGAIILLTAFVAISTAKTLILADEVSETLKRGISDSEVPTEALTVIDKQSFPKVGDNLTIAFRTEGTANLTIMFENETSAEDLEILELKRGNENLEFMYIIQK